MMVGDITVDGRVADLPSRSGIVDAKEVYCQSGLYSRAWTPDCDFRVAAQCLLLAQNRRAGADDECPLLRDERTRRSGTRIVDSQLAQDISRMLFASGISRLFVSDSAGRGFSALEAVASIALRISSTVASV